MLTCDNRSLTESAESLIQIGALRFKFLRHWFNVFVDTTSQMMFWLRRASAKKQTKFSIAQRQNLFIYFTFYFNANPNLFAFVWIARISWWNQEQMFVDKQFSFRFYFTSLDEEKFRKNLRLVPRSVLWLATIIVSEKWISRNISLGEEFNFATQWILLGFCFVFE